MRIKVLLTPVTRGRKLGGSEYILFLNPDVRLFPDSLVKASPFPGRTAEQTGRYPQAFSLLIKWYNPAQCGSFPHTKISFLPNARLGPPLAAAFPVPFHDRLGSSRKPRSGPRAGCFLPRTPEGVRGITRVSTNGFLCTLRTWTFAFRAKQAGWKSYYLADAQALHYGGGASNQVKARRLSYVLNSRVLYVAKHFGVPAA